MDKQDEHNIPDYIKDALLEQYRLGYQAGFRRGIHTTSQMVLDKLTNKKNKFLQRIQDAADFCHVGLKMMEVELSHSSEGVQNETIARNDDNSNGGESSDTAE